MSFNLSGFAEGVSQYQNEKAQKSANRLKKMQIMNAAMQNLPVGSSYKNASDFISSYTGDKNFFEDVYDENMFGDMMKYRTQKREHENAQMDAQRDQWREREQDRYMKFTKRAIANTEDPSKLKDTALTYIDDEDQEGFNEWWENTNVDRLRKNHLREEAVRASGDLAKLGFTPDDYKESDVYQDLHQDIKADVDRRMSTRARDEALKITSRVDSQIQTSALQDAPMRTAIANGDQQAVESRVRAFIPRNAARYYGEDEVSRLSRDLIRQNRNVAQKQVTTGNMQLAGQIANAANAQGKTPAEIMSDPTLPDDVKQLAADQLQRIIDKRVGGEVEAVSKRFMGNEAVQDMVSKGEWEAVESYVRGTIEREHPEIAGDEAVTMIMGALKTELEPITAATQYDKVVQNKTKMYQSSIQSAREMEIAKAATNTSGDIPGFYNQETITGVSDQFDDDEQTAFNTNIAGAYNTLVNTTLVSADQADVIFGQLASKYAEKGVIPNVGSLKAEARLALSRNGLSHLLKDPSAQVTEYKSRITRELLENRDAGSVLNEYETNVGSLTQKIGEYDAVVDRYAQTMDKQEFIQATRNAKTKHLTELANMRSKVQTMMNNPQAFTGFDRKKVLNMLNSLEAAIQQAQGYDFGAKAQEIYGQQQAEREQPEQHKSGVLDYTPYSFFGFGNLPQ